MTIDRLAEKYGTKVYRASIHETLFSVSLNIYKSYSDKGMLVLSRLNPLINWNNIEPGTELIYINCPESEVAEVW